MKTNWVWCDLEMTGLDEEKDCIIEIATVITDSELNIIAEGPNYVIHQPPSRMQDLDPWIIKNHGESGLLKAVKESTVSQEQAEAETLRFIQAHTEYGKAPLCGNSIGTDRSFLKRHMPELEAHMHYRNVDVTSIKILYDAWYSGASLTKKMQHRALDDIKESITELKFYQKEIFKNDVDRGV